MRVTGKGCVIEGEGGRRSPPEPFVEIDDAEAAELVALKLAAPYRDADETPAALFGSSVLPALVAVGDAEIQLGDIVRRAAGNATADDWNALPEGERDTLIEAALNAMRLEAGRLADNSLPTPPADDAAAGVGDTAMSGGAADDTDASGDAARDDTAGTGDAEAIDANRAQAITDAIELLEDEHRVKTGPRAGLPKVSAIEEITGLSNVTADEIDAIVAALSAAD